MTVFDRYNFDTAGSFFKNIINNDITGVVIGNALTEQDCDDILNILPLLKDKYFTDLNDQNGYSLPSMFGQLHKSLPFDLTTKYFNDITPFTSDVDLLYKSDFSHKISELLARAVQPFSVKCLDGFLPYSFRVVYTGKEGLSLHRDKDLLPYIHGEVAGIIIKNIDPGSLLSWFITIQQPEKGGELWVGDSYYNEYQKEKDFLLASDGHKVSPLDIPHTNVSTEKGSLLIFRGGNYWHKVIPPLENSKDRVTLGGFMALSDSGEFIYIWS